MGRHQPIRAIVVAGCCAALLAACGSSATQSRSPSVADSAGLSFANCMRSHGVTNFPDPPSGGGIQITPNSGLDPQSPSFQSAQQACQHLMPGPVTPPKMTAAAHAAALKFSACMRAHGVPSFPDPIGAGSAPAANALTLVIRGMEFQSGAAEIDPRAPAFRHAATACGVRVPSPAP